MKQHFESWRIFHIARTKLPKKIIHSLYTQKTRLVEKWAANPRTCGQTARNPIDRIRIMLDELNVAGYGDYSRMAIDYMAEPLGGQFAENGSVVSDKGSVDGEIADISIALGDLGSEVRAALKDGKLDADERMRIVEAARGAKHQIEELLDAAGMNE